jgi:hypothetical protein
MTPTRRADHLEDQQGLSQLGIRWTVEGVAFP